jgi:hypothetical protein
MRLCPSPSPSLAHKHNPKHRHIIYVVMVHIVDVILEEVVILGVVNLENVLIVAIVIILWSIVGIYTASHLGLPIKFLLRRIL